MMTNHQGISRQGMDDFDEVTSENSFCIDTSELYKIVRWEFMGNAAARYERDNTLMPRKRQKNRQTGRSGGGGMIRSILVIGYSLWVIVQ